jgi:outer membrane protein OmpA-like peptidoglycan-associated protein
LAALLVVLGLAVGCDLPPPVPVYAVASRGADRDGDGVADVDDACPDDPEDGLPPKANDGCPADDPDNDHIGRAQDRCPNAKEDGLPPEPTDGCPTTDTDGDGVADARDKCPNEREDNLPPDPSDGCPSPDRDGDGIADIADKCPGQPETFNGYRDDDGCPDVVPAGGAVAFDDQAAVIYVPETRKIEFATDSAELTPEARATIADVASVLTQHPEIGRVEIEGHASTKGDDAHNLDLTARRSVAVARALEALGVAASRLVPVGYGEYCPAVNRGDDVDEPRNRRVLLKAVVVNGVWQSVSRGCWRAKTAGIDPTSRQPDGATHARASSPAVRPAGGA